MTAAAQSVEGDMRDSISAELQLNQVQVVRSARLFGPGMRAQIESGSASKKYRQRSRRAFRIPSPYDACPHRAIRPRFFPSPQWGPSA